MIAPAKPLPKQTTPHLRILWHEVADVPEEVREMLPPCENLTAEQEHLDDLECSGQSENWWLVGAIFAAAAVLVVGMVRIWWQFT